MLDSDKRRRFVELRGDGMSYVKISKEIEVSKNTLVKWSREYSVEIGNFKAMEIERIREEYQLGREHRLRVIGMQLSKVTQEILARDFSDVATWRLFEVQRKLIAETEKDDGKIEFVQETQGNGVDSLKNMFKKIERWTG
jgi:transposase-like protein